MYGLIDGNKIKLFSTDRLTANNAPFSFYGTATNNRMEGEIYMYEYLRAKFIATRYKQEFPANRSIVIPQGQPLAT